MVFPHIGLIYFCGDLLCNVVESNLAVALSYEFDKNEHMILVWKRICHMRT